MSIIKMCTVGELKGAGYSTDMDNDKYCPSKEGFLSRFSKAKYELSIENREDKQLFPLDAITETAIIKEPSLAFANEQMTLNYKKGQISNGFTYENLEGPWIVEILDGNMERHAETIVNVADKIVYVTCQENTDTIADFECTVRLTGTRTDGWGTYSAEFKVTQYAYSEYYILRIYNRTVPGTIIQVNDKNGITVLSILYDNDDTTNIYSTGQDTINLLTDNETIHFSVTGEDNVTFINRANGSAVITYEMIHSQYPNKNGQEIALYVTKV